MIWHNISCIEAAQKLEVDEEKGLTDKTVELRRQSYGKNELKHKKGKNLAQRFLEQLNDYMVIILLIAAVISFGVSVLNHEADFVDPIIILIIVLLNATIGVFQENKAEKALEALKKMSSPTAKVLRDGNIIAVNSDELVVGDIIYLQSGDFVPADARIIECFSLKTDEAMLTGESIPVEKDGAVIKHTNVTIADCKNMLWASTIVTCGRASAIVVETGMNTEVGKIAGMIDASESPQTPLQEKLAKTGEALGTIALAICAIIFVVGVFRKVDPFDMFMTSVSLAVAAIPEGLPAIVTIMLAIGVQNMARKNAIIRKLPAVETLGSASVICSDKTGTLTQNKMTVTDVFGDRHTVLTLAALCNNNADPTEIAIIIAAQKNNIDKKILEEDFKKISEIPFDSSRKMMTTIHKFGSGYRIITKGAPDILLSKCDVDKAEKEKIIEKNSQMAQNALRVLAVAYKDVDAVSKNPEQNLKFAGLIGIIDPPRPEVKDAVRVCRRAGIKPVMITGDHIDTAAAIAKEIGILRDGESAIAGYALNKMTDEELTKEIYHYSVFARVTPEHKVRIVNAYQKRGAVVAMTGDGVNDAPALKAADIGCAMGITGTDVAKGAADMVLVDDNFATIIEAVRQGRGIYANIRKSIHFLLSSNIGEIITIFTAILCGWQTPLVAVQLLWVNLVTDSLPAIALGVDGNDEKIMHQKPIDRKKGLFADGLSTTIFLEGIMIGLLSLIAFRIGSHRFDESIAVGRTMAFAVLGLSQLVHSFNVRSSQSLFKIGVFSNKFLVFAFIICSIMQIGVITIPKIAAIFKVVPLGVAEWITVAVLSLVPIVVIEIDKLFAKNRRLC